MRARALAREIERRLAAEGVDEAAFEAEYLVRTATAMSRASFFTDPEVSATLAATVRELAARRATREPAAYIAGEREFYGLTFGVSRQVLVPRPETELLVDLGLSEARALQAPLIVDVGTGSGAVAVAIAANLPPAARARVVATEISRGAIAVARANRDRHGVRVEFVLGDLAGCLDHADVVLANLPYIPTWEIDELEPEVSAWEPRVALDGGTDGFALIRRLVADCAARLRPRLLAVEVGFGMAAGAAAIVGAAGATAEVLKDLGGIDRVVVARWA